MSHLPADMDTVDVTGRLVTGDYQHPLAGRIKFEPSVRLSSSVHETIVLGPFYAVLNEEGYIKDPSGEVLKLPVTDDPDIHPQGWYYRVTEELEGRPKYTWLMNAPLAEGNINYASKAPQEDGMSTDRRVVSVNDKLPDASGNIELIAEDIPGFGSTLGQNVVANWFRVGPENLEPDLTQAGPDSAYSYLDRGNRVNDASMVFTTLGQVEGEIGLMGGDSPSDDKDLHIKTATGPIGEEDYTSAIVVKNATSDVWFPQRIGIGDATDPAEQLHIGLDSPDAKVICKVENGATTPGTARSAGFGFSSDLVEWTFATDVGMNSGDDIGLQSTTIGYTPVMIWTADGRVGINTDSPGAELDVNGYISVQNEPVAPEHVVRNDDQRLYRPACVPFQQAGTLAVGDLPWTWYNDIGSDVTVQTLRASVGTMPAGAGVVVQLKVNGVVAGSATIADGTSTVKEVSPIAVPADAAVTIRVNQIGSVTPGSNLLVNLTLV